MTLRIAGGLCLLPEDTGHRAVRADLLVADGRIAAVLPDGEGPPAAETLAARGFLVAPGFVNAHTHSPDNLIRGTAPNLPLELWSLSSAAGREGRSPREVYIAALLGCIELLHTGTTTVLDHIRFSPALDPDSLDAVARAYRDAGLRAIVAPVVADRPVVETLPLDPADLAEAGTDGYGRAPLMPAAEQVRLIEDFIVRWHDPDRLLSAAIGPSGPQRCSDRLLELAGDLSRRRGVLWHSHVLETKAQRVMAERLYGGSMIRHLDRLGLLGPRSSLVHLIWADAGDLDIVARSGASVIHNPVSNAKLGSGVCPLPDILRRGIAVGLGTDSACCNDSNNLLETAKWTALLHSLRAAEPEDWIGPARALHLATAGGARALGLTDVTGAIAPGLAADLVFFRLDSPGLAPLNDPVRQLVQSESGRAIDTVMIGGRIAMTGGRCTHINQDDIWAEARELAAGRLRDNAAVYRSAAALAEPIRRMYRRIDRAGGPS